MRFWREASVVTSITLSYVRFDLISRVFMETVVAYSHYLHTLRGQELRTRCPDNLVHRIVNPESGDRQSVRGLSGLDHVSDISIASRSVRYLVVDHWAPLIFDAFRGKSKRVPRDASEGFSAYVDVKCRVWKYYIQNASNSFGP